MRELRSTIERHGYVFAVACIAASTGVFLVGRGYFAKGQWALLYLLIIGLVAGLSGVRPALLAAVLAFFTWNYFFLPPFHTFVVADPKDWLSLVAFLIVGMSVGLLTGRMRDREAEAVVRERETLLLNEFSGHLVSDTTVEDMADLLIREVKRITKTSRVTLLLTDKSGVMKEVGPESGRDEGKDEIFIPLRTASRQEGALYIGCRLDGEPFSERDIRFLEALANLSAAFLERKHLQSVAVQSEALQEADKLKNTLISSVSHELKTPLASITATVSNLLEQDVEWDEPHVREELLAVEDDLQRLNSSIGALLDLSRLEASAWEPKKELYEFGEILGTAVSKIPQKQRSRIKYDLPDDLPQIAVDFPQWSRAIQNLLENALSYSPEESSVRVGASASEDDVRIWVEDEGPGILPEDKNRIFEKFYRGATSAKVPSGTGLGLAVTREIVKSHQGRIWVEDVAPHGARMVISLPKGADEA
jgi:two-component system sensor histidine kinase KdpD